MKKTIIFLFCLLICISVSAQSIKIASFNLHQFGNSQLENQNVMDVLVKIIGQFDLIAIQEVQNKKGDALEKLDSLLGNTYSYIVGVTNRFIDPFVFGMLTPNEL